MIGDDVMVTLITTDADEHLLESSVDGGAYTTVLEGDGDIDTDRVFSAGGAPGTVTYRLTATNTVGSVTASDSIEIVAADTATPTPTPTNTPTSTNDSQLPTAFVTISPAEVMQDDIVTYTLRTTDADIWQLDISTDGGPFTLLTSGFGDISQIDATLVAAGNPRTDTFRLTATNSFGSVSAEASYTIIPSSRAAGSSAQTLSVAEQIILNLSRPDPASTAGNAGRPSGGAPCRPPAGVRIRGDQDGRYSFEWPVPDGANVARYIFGYAVGGSEATRLATTLRNVTIAESFPPGTTISVAITAVCDAGDSPGAGATGQTTFVAAAAAEIRTLPLQRRPAAPSEGIKPNGSGPRVDPEGYYYRYSINDGPYSAEVFTTATGAALGDVGDPGDTVRFQVRSLCQSSPLLASDYETSPLGTIPFPPTATHTATATDTATSTATPTLGVPPPPDNVTIDCAFSITSTVVTLSWAPSPAQFQRVSLHTYRVNLDFDPNDADDIVHPPVNSAVLLTATTYQVTVTGDDAFTATGQVQVQYGDTVPEIATSIYSAITADTTCARAPPTATSTATFAATSTATHTATATSTPTATLAPVICPKPTGLSFDLLSDASVTISWSAVDFQPSGLPTAFVEFSAETVMAGDAATVTLRTTDADSYRLESSRDGGDYTTILDQDGNIDTVIAFSADGDPRTVTYRLTATNTAGSASATDSITIVEADTATPTQTPEDTATPTLTPEDTATPTLTPEDTSTSTNTPLPQPPTAFVEFSPATIMVGETATVTLRTTDTDGWFLESIAEGGATTIILSGVGDVDTVIEFSDSGSPGTVRYRLTAVNAVETVTASDRITIVAAGRSQREVCRPPTSVRIRGDQDGRYSFEWPVPAGANVARYIFEYAVGGSVVAGSEATRLATTLRNVTVSDGWKPGTSIAIAITAVCGAGPDVVEHAAAETAFRAAAGSDVRTLALQRRPAAPSEGIKPNGSGPRDPPEGYYYRYSINDGPYSAEVFTTATGASLGDIGDPGDTVRFQVRALCQSIPLLESDYATSPLGTIPFPPTATHTATATATSTSTATATSTATPTLGVPPPPAAATLDCAFAVTSTVVTLNWAPSPAQFQRVSLHTYRVNLDFEPNDADDIVHPPVNGDVQLTATSYQITVSGDAAFTATGQVQVQYGDTVPEITTSVYSAITADTTCARAPPTATSTSTATSTATHTATSTATPTLGVPPPPDNVTIDCAFSVTSTVVTLNWAPSPAQFQRVSLHTYRVNLDFDPNDADDIVHPPVGSDVQLSATSYQVTVMGDAAFTATGHSGSRSSTATLFPKSRDQRL